MLARAQTGLGKDCVVRSHEDLRRAPRLRPLQRVGDGHRPALVQYRKLRLAAAPHDGHHAIALLEAPDIGAARRDLARQLQAGNIGR